MSVTIIPGVSAIVVASSLIAAGLVRRNGNVTRRGCKLVRLFNNKLATLIPAARICQRTTTKYSNEAMGLRIRYPRVDRPGREGVWSYMPHRRFVPPMVLLNSNVAHAHRGSIPHNLLVTSPQHSTFKSSWHFFLVRAHVKLGLEPRHSASLESSPGLAATSSRRLSRPVAPSTKRMLV